MTYLNPLWSYNKLKPEITTETKTFAVDNLKHR